MVQTSGSWLILWLLSQCLEELAAYLSDAQRLFDGTGVQVTVEGKHHLGAALDSCFFTEQYVSEKVVSWSHCVAKLSEIAKFLLHIVYSAFTHGLCNYVTNGLTFCIPFQGFLHF